MIDAVLLALWLTWVIESLLGVRRRRERNEEIKTAFLNGVKAANAVHNSVQAIPRGEARH